AGCPGSRGRSATRSATTPCAMLLLLSQRVRDVETLDPTLKDQGQDGRRDDPEERRGGHLVGVGDLEEHRRERGREGLRRRAGVQDQREGELVPGGEEGDHRAG